MNNHWLKPSIIFVVGVILGISGMYLAGVRPWGNSGFYQGVPDIAGLSGAGLALIKDNTAVINADLILNLTGIIKEIRGNTLIITNGESPPITVVIQEQTSFYKPPPEGSDQITNLTLQDLQQDQLIQIFGRLEGNQIVAETIIQQNSR